MSTATFPERLFAPAAGGEESTLDDLVVKTVEDLALRERGRCLVCSGELAATGHCPDCHSSLN
jgi:tRNA(Ile2) C34 agmatinyltransferase TiaS